MAEPISTISGVATLASITLACIQNTIKFLREVREIDSLIQELLDALLDLERSMEVVKSTCERATSHDDKPSSFVRESLSRCESRLREVQAMAENLASQNSTTFWRRLRLKLRYDGSRRELKNAIQTIERLNSNIHKAISGMTLDKAYIIEQHLSAALLVQQALINTPELPQIAEMEAIGPLRRTFSVASTAYEQSLDAVTRRDSVATEHSQHSISSRSSDDPSLIARTASTISDTDCDLVVSFRRCMGEYKGDAAKLQEIERLLKQHPDPSKLANAEDQWGRTPLHFAAQFGHIHLARLLLEHGANIDARDPHSRSALNIALEETSADRFVVFLLNRHVDETVVTTKKERRRLQEIKQAMELRKKVAAKRSSKSKEAVRRTNPMAT